MARTMVRTGGPVVVSHAAEVGPTGLVEGLPGDLRLSGSHPGMVVWRGQTWEVTPTQWRLALALAVEAGQVVTYERILEALYGDWNVMLGAAVHWHKWGLLRAVPGLPVVTVRGWGMMLDLERERVSVVDVERVPELPGLGGEEEEEEEE